MAEPHRSHYATDAVGRRAAPLALALDEHTPQELAGRSARYRVHDDDLGRPLVGRHALGQPRGDGARLGRARTA